jgi:hypothetical protein
MKLIIGLLNQFEDTAILIMILVIYLYNTISLHFFQHLLCLSEGIGFSNKDDAK